MKNWIIAILVLFAIDGQSQEQRLPQTDVIDAIATNSPEGLAQEQLDAYNVGDIDAFLVPYADSVEIYAFPDRLISKGKEAMRETYGQMFSQLPELHCRLDNRIVMGDTVIDHEYITGIPNQEPFSAIAIYKIAEDKIQQVYFIQ